MNLLWGKITNILKAVSKNGVHYIRLTIVRYYINKEGQVQAITNHVTSFEEYVINQFENNLLVIGDYVVASCLVTAQTYKNQQGEVKAILNYTSNRVDVLSLDRLLVATPPQPQVPQPQVPQPQVQQPQVQQPQTQYTNVRQPQMQVQYNNVQQPQVQQPQMQVQYNNVQNTTPQSTNNADSPWELDI